MRTIKHLAILTLLLLAQKSYAQSFTLEQAQQYGLANREKIKNAQLDLLSAKKKVWETTAIGLPQINAEGNFQEYINIPTSVVDASFVNPNAGPGEVVSFRMGQKYNVVGGINASQLIFDGSYIVGLQVSKFYTQFVQSSIEKSEQEIQYQIAQAYYNVLVGMENLVLLDSLELSADQLLKNTTVFYDQGMIEKEEVDQLELNLIRISSMKVTATRQVEIAKHLLKLQMGYPINDPITLEGSLKDYLKQIEFEYAELKGSIKENINYVMMEQQKRLSEYDLKNKRFQHFPQLAAFFQHQYMAFRNEFNFFQDKPWYPSTAWGITLKIPIISSGMRAMQVQQAKIEVEKNDNSLKELQRTLEFQEIQTKLNFENALTQTKLEQRNIELAKQIYRNTNLKKEVGMVSSLQVTQTYAQVLTAQTDYINAILQIMNAKNELDNLYGNYNKFIVEE
jgi:outer membrane protein